MWKLGQPKVTSSNFEALPTENRPAAGTFATLTRSFLSRRGFAGSLLVGLVLAAGLGSATWHRLKAEESPPASVRLVIDYGDGVQIHFLSLRWRDGMTVLDALAGANAHSHGITFGQRGSGATAMITQIGDLKNQGDGKNWMFAVNDKTSQVGAGAHALKAGDTVLWSFKAYDYNP